MVATREQALLALAQVESLPPTNLAKNVMQLLANEAHCGVHEHASIFIHHARTVAEALRPIGKRYAEVFQGLMDTPNMRQLCEASIGEGLDQPAIWYRNRFGLQSSRLRKMAGDALGFKLNSYGALAIVYYVAKEFGGLE